MVVNCNFRRFLLLLFVNTGVALLLTSASVEIEADDARIENEIIDNRVAIITSRGAGRRIQRSMQEVIMFLCCCFLRLAPCPVLALAK